MADDKRRSSAPQSFWLDLTNAAMGVGVLPGLVALIVAIAAEFLPARRA